MLNFFCSFVVCVSCMRMLEVIVCGYEKVGVFFFEGGRVFYMNLFVDEIC